MMASLGSARSALDAGSWQQARAAFGAVAAETGDPLAHEGLARAAWWLDEGETCVAAWEAAYRRHRELGDPLGAARAATGLAWDSLLFGYGESVARGWWGRAGALLEGLEESVEHGWHAVREAELPSRSTTTPCARWTPRGARRRSGSGSATATSRWSARRCRGWR